MHYYVISQHFHNIVKCDSLHRIFDQLVCLCVLFEKEDGGFHL